MRRRVRPARTQRGAAAVEFGLIAPLLLLLVFGIADFGYMLLKSHLVNNVARDAVRAASLSGSYADVDAVVDDELADAGITGASVTTSITCSSPDGTTCTGSQASFDANAQSGSAVSVSIAYTHQWITPFGSLCSVVADGPCVGDTIVIQRTASMVRE